jgi:hypothetical protein
LYLKSTEGANSISSIWVIWVKSEGLPIESSLSNKTITLSSLSKSTFVTTPILPARLLPRKYK